MLNIIKTKILSEQPFVAELDSRLDRAILNKLSTLEINKPSGVGHIHNAKQNDFRTSKTLHTANTSDYLFLTEHLIKVIKQELGHEYDIANSERIQFTRYDEGNYFKPHVDFHNQDRNNPVVTKDRITTAILYINDDYTGGETYFPDLDIRIKPEQGKILYFTYGVNDPIFVNRMTKHEGETVELGYKVIATQWFLEDK
jgi:prolyl 4-hydroxylase